MQTEADASYPDANSIDARVLLVVDNPVDRDLAIALLEGVGCQVDAVASGRDALTQWIGSGYELILIDPLVSGLGGPDDLSVIEAIRRLESDRQVEKPIAVVALVRDLTDAARTQCLEAGMNDCVGKPYEPSEFARVVTFWLEAAKKIDRVHSVAGTVMEFLVDSAALDKIRELESPASPGIFRKVLQLFIDESPVLLESLDLAVQTADAALLRRSAHSLKSSSAMVGALELSALCRTLEDIGRSESVEGARELVSQAEVGFDSTKTQLESTLSATPSTSVDAFTGASV